MKKNGMANCTGSEIISNQMNLDFIYDDEDHYKINRSVAFKMPGGVQD